MSILILIHVVTGLVGIASGLVALGGTFLRKPMARWSALFLSATAAASATGLVFLPIDGITSAQIVALFSVVLLAVAAYARYVQRLEGGWNEIYAIAATEALFLNVLIATAQSFLHVQFLKALAPTQHSPAYVSIKITLFALFITIAFIVAKRGGRRATE